MADDIGTYRQALAGLLKSQATDVWSDEELEAAIRLALVDLSQRLPRSLSADVTLEAAGRCVSLATLTDCLWVEEAWWPYESASLPANAVPFEVREGSLTLFTVGEPQAGDSVHLLYAGRHTIAGLDGADTTTLASDWRGVIALGAAGYAAAAKAVAMAREYSWPGGAAVAMRNWSGMMLALFEARLKAARSPATQAWVTWG
ncbi:MAG: hypothetical protein ACYC5O_16790 [Anaerolineae bacterium]